MSPFLLFAIICCYFSTLFFRFKIFFYHLHNHTGQQEDCDQVRDCHQSVERFRDAPEKP